MTCSDLQRRDKSVVFPVPAPPIKTENGEQANSSRIATFSFLAVISFSSLTVDMESKYSLTIFSQFSVILKRSAFKRSSINFRIKQSISCNLLS